MLLSLTGSMGKLRHKEIKSLGQATQLVGIRAGIQTQRLRMPIYVFNTSLDNMRVSRRGGILRGLLTNLTHFKSPAGLYFSFFVSRFNRLQTYM